MESTAHTTAGFPSSRPDPRTTETARTLVDRGTDHLGTPLPAIPVEDLSFLQGYIWTQIRHPVLGRQGRWLKMAAVGIAALCIVIGLALMAAWFHGVPGVSFWAALVTTLGGIAPLIYAFDTVTRLRASEEFAKRFVAILASPDVFRHQSANNPTMMVFEALPATPPGITPVREVFGRSVEVHARDQRMDALRIEIPVSDAAKIWEFLELCAGKFPDRPAPALNDRQRAAATELVRRLTSDDH